MINVRRPLKANCLAEGIKVRLDLVFGRRWEKSPLYNVKDNWLPVLCREAEVRQWGLHRDALHASAVKGDVFCSCHGVCCAALAAGIWEENRPQRSFQCNRKCFCSHVQFSGDVSINVPVTLQTVKPVHHSSFDIQRSERVAHLI